MLSCSTGTVTKTEMREVAQYGRPWPYGVFVPSGADIEPMIIVQHYVNARTLLAGMALETWLGSRPDSVLHCESRDPGAATRDLLGKTGTVLPAGADDGLVQSFQLHVSYDRELITVHGGGAGHESTARRGKKR